MMLDALPNTFFTALEIPGAAIATAIATSTSMTAYSTVVTPFCRFEDFLLLMITSLFISLLLLVEYPIRSSGPSERHTFFPKDVADATRALSRRKSAEGDI